MAHLFNPLLKYIFLNGKEGCNQSQHLDGKGKARLHSQLAINIQQKKKKKK